MRKGIGLLVILAAAGLVVGNTRLRAQPAEDAAIKQLIHQMVNAYNNKDLVKYEAVCDPDVLTIEAGNKFVGWAGLGDNLKMEWDMLSDGYYWNMGEIQVHFMGKEFAWATHEGSFQGKMKDGTQLQESIAETYIFQKKGGAWKLVHAHISSRPMQK